MCSTAGTTGADAQMRGRMRMKSLVKLSAPIDSLDPKTASVASEAAVNENV